MRDDIETIRYASTYAVNTYAVNRIAGGVYTS